MNRKKNIPITLRVVAIVVIVSVFGLALPYVALVLLMIVGRSIPDGVYDDYPGFSAKFTGGRVFELYINPQEKPNLYLNTGRSVKNVYDICEQDLLDLGFTKGYTGYIKMTNPIYSFASLSTEGRLKHLSLVHVEEARVPFSASPDGPFLELPVSRQEFEKQFGKPLSTRYSYPNPNDPR
jgi:hypothetical protein